MMLKLRCPICPKGILKILAGNYKTLMVNSHIVTIFRFFYDRLTRSDDLIGRAFVQISVSTV